MSTYITHKEAKETLIVKSAIVLIALVCVAAFAPFADASRTSLRLDAGLNRPAATAQPGTGGTGGTNGGTSGGSSSSSQDAQDPTVNEALAQAMLDELIASDPQPQDFPNDNLGDGAQEEVENLDEEPEAVSFITLFHSIISRFRSQ